ncbi:hypothetical protein CHCC14427_2046 [Bacillus paralicheniformis]|nr:hypothetical protein CHCC14427_2046 [Bacillus paralicheniformis]
MTGIKMTDHQLYVPATKNPGFIKKAKQILIKGTMKIIFLENVLLNFRFSAFA